jgi:CheY-like chemotaxis protein
MTKRVVIVVDDNAASRMLPALILRPFPLTVVECDTAQGVWSALAQNEVSHVLLDISMPGVNGMDVARSIRADPAYAHVKLVAYTADAHLAPSGDLSAWGFDHVLVKPIQRDGLLAVLGLS